MRMHRDFHSELILTRTKRQSEFLIFEKYPQILEMAADSEKKLDVDESGAEIIKNIKRSGVFDNIKKDVLKDLQEMVCFFQRLR
jgi:hypothetical protein